MVVFMDGGPIPPRFLASREDGLGNGHVPHWEYDGCVFYIEDDAQMAYLHDLRKYLKRKHGRPSMKRWVRLHKDGDHMGVETNCTDERDFWAQFSAVLADALENKFLGHAQEQLQRWLPQAFECVAQLRGYKADVVVEQVVRAGEVYSGNQEVFSSERPQLTVVPKEQAG